MKNGSPTGKRANGNLTSAWNTTGGAEITEW